MIKGQVSGMQQRMEPREQGPALLVWDYRLERTDEAGKPIPRVPVEMRGTSFDGGINNGDWIEIDASWTVGSTLRPQSVRNLTTNATVTASGGPGLRQEPVSTTPPGDSVPPSGDMVVGQARRVQQRAQLVQGGSLMFLNFRLDRTDAPPLSVEMRGAFLSGSVSEGDSVQVPARVTAGGVVQTDRVFNLTTRSDVTMSRGVSAAWHAYTTGLGRRAAIVAAAAGIVLTLAAVGFLGFVAFNLFAPGDPFATGGQVSVPDVRGMDNVEAARTLSDAGLSPRGTFDTSSDIEFGRVIRTDPPAGTRVARGSGVTFAVSTGPPH